jgi:hypothetical protein
MSQLKPEEQAVLNALDSEGKEYQNYFFSKAKDLKWFRPLKDLGYFQPSQNPPPQESDEKRLYTIPVWPALLYLEKLSPELARPENRNYAGEIIQIIREVSRPPSGNKADNYRTWVAFARILSNIPVDLIQYADLDLVGDWVKSQFGASLLGRELGQHLVPRFLQNSNLADWEKAERLIEIVTEVRIVEKVYGKEHKVTNKEVHTALDSYSLRELFKYNSELLGKRVGQEIVKILSKRIKESSTSASHNELSHIWRRAIEDHAQNIGAEDTEHVLVSAFRDVLCSFASEKIDEASDVLRALLTDESVLVRRVALHTINKHYSLYPGLLWEILEPQWFQSQYKHELYQLINLNFSKFSSPEQATLIEIIRKLTYEHSDERDSDRRDMAMRLDWLHAIRGKGNVQADQLYDQYIGVVEYVPKHPDFSSYFEVRRGNLAPNSKDQLLKLSVTEIVEYLEEFQETGHWEDPTEEGLADVLMEAVKEDPKKFDTEVHRFLDSKLAYQYEILRGFEEAWKLTKSFDWKAVLTFCERLIDRDGFWELKDKRSDAHLRATRSWITSVICSLISCGVSNDDWAFDEPFLPLAEQIILKIIRNEPPTAKGRDDDALTEAMNTPKGRCIECLIAYSLRNAWLFERKGQERKTFLARIQQVFDDELVRCVGGNYEFSALAGRNILQLHYLSQEWLKARINDIFSLVSERNWRCAMQGYSYVNLVHPDIYAWLKNNGHLRKVLNVTWRNKDVRKKIIQQIAVQYIGGKEELTGDSLFADILRSWKEKDISEIIWQFWVGREQKLSDSQRRRVLEFWKWCSDKIRKREEENARILSDLLQLTCYLSEMGQDEEAMVTQAAPYADLRYHSSFFIEYLNALSVQFPKAVANVFLAMLTRVVPSFQEEDIVSIVNNLYSRGLKDEANKIANIYTMKGYEFLRAVYSKNNPDR